MKQTRKRHARAYDGAHFSICGRNLGSPIMGTNYTTNDYIQEVTCLSCLRSQLKTEEQHIITAHRHLKRRRERQGLLRAQVHKVRRKVGRLT